MTHFSKDSVLCFARRVTVVAGIVASAVLAPVSAAAVAMTDSVQKVERYVDADGQVKRRLVTTDQVIPGDELRYTIEFANDGRAAIDARSIVITNPLPEDTVYIDGTAFGSGTVVEYSVDNGETFAPAAALTVERDGVSVPASAADYTTIRWTFEPVLEPGENSNVSFNVRLR